MKVTSPIGELPFTVRGVSLRDGRVVVDGELGAWRSRLEVGPDDIPMLARALRRPLIAAGAGLVAIALLRRL
jgi:hypothetical protein